MWRRCLVPLVSQDIDKTQQKERWRYVLEKFSHYNMGVVRRNRLPVEAEAHLLDIPECKRGRFIKSPSESPSSEAPPTSQSEQTSLGVNPLSKDYHLVELMNNDSDHRERSIPLFMSNNDPALLLEDNQVTF